MPSNKKKVTSPEIAKIASKLLKTSRIKKVKKVAASDLSQAVGKKKSKKKK